MCILYVVLVAIIPFSFAEDIIDSCYSKNCDISDNRFSLYNALGTNCSSKVPKYNIWYYRSKTSAIQLNVNERWIKYINVTKPIKLLIHGLGEGILSDHDTMLQIKNSYSDANGTDLTILQIDYGSSLPNTRLYTYPRGACNLYDVAFKTSDFLCKLITKYGFSAENMHLIGFSFGAHLAGIIGYLLKTNCSSTLGRITGLDPLGAGYLCVTCDWLKLDKTDATFVEVIHTNSGHIGMSESIGHEDFYVNWPSAYQPGCLEFEHPGCFWLNVSGCAHLTTKHACFSLHHPDCNHTMTADECSSIRSCALFAESIFYNDFLATSCYSILTLLECLPIDYTYMGEYAIPAKYDDYYLLTRDEPPYGLEHEKSKPSSSSLNETINEYVHKVPLPF